MSKYFTRLTAGGLLLLAGSAMANQPVNITYKPRGDNEPEVAYSTYVVRCTDETNRTITAWNGRKKWCVGISTKNCTNDQLKTAKQACSLPSSK